MPQNHFESYVHTMSRIDHVFSRFFDYCENINIELLSDDKNWLKKICYGQSSTNLEPLLKNYIKIWLEEMRKEPLKHKQQNKGRHYANTWVRENLVANRK